MGEYVPNLRKRGWVQSKTHRWNGSVEVIDEWSYSNRDRRAIVSHSGWLDRNGDRSWEWFAEAGTRTMRGYEPNLGKAIRAVEAFWGSDVDSSCVTYEAAFDYLVTVASFSEMKWDGCDWLERPEPLLLNRCVEAIASFAPFDLHRQLDAHGTEGMWAVLTAARKRAKAYEVAKGQFDSTGGINLPLDS